MTPRSAPKRDRQKASLSSTVRGRALAVVVGREAATE